MIVRALVRFGPVPVVGPLWFAFGVIDLVCALIRTDRRGRTDVG